MPTMIEAEERVIAIRRPHLMDCPFCGNYPSVRREVGITVIECRAEGCKAQAAVTASSEAEAVTIWNRRR